MILVLELTGARPGTLRYSARALRSIQQRPDALSRYISVIRPDQKFEYDTEDVLRAGEHLIVHSGAQLHSEVAGLLRRLDEMQPTSGDGAVVVASWLPQIYALADQWRGQRTRVSAARMADLGRWPGQVSGAAFVPVPFAEANSPTQLPPARSAGPLTIQHFSFDVVEGALRALIDVLTINGADSEERAVHATLVMPLICLQLPDLKGQPTTGLTGRVVELGQRRGVLRTAGVRPNYSVWLDSPRAAQIHREGKAFPHRELTPSHGTDDATLAFPSAQSYGERTEPDRISEQSAVPVPADTSQEEDASPTLRTAVSEAAFGPQSRRIDIGVRARCLFDAALKALLEGDYLKAGPMSRRSFRNALQRELIRLDVPANDPVVLNAERLSGRYINGLAEAGCLLDSDSEITKLYGAGEQVERVRPNYSSRLQLLLLAIIAKKVGIRGNLRDLHELGRFLRPTVDTETMGSINNLLESGLRAGILFRDDSDQVIRFKSHDPFRNPVLEFEVGSTSDSQDTAVG